MVYSFAGYELDLDRFELRRGGTVCPVEPQVFDVLRYLVEHRDRVVTKNELLDNVWGDRFVSESALTSRIKAARRVLGDTGKEQAVIRTAHGRGYRFVADVVILGDVEPHRPLVEPLRVTGDDWPLVGRESEIETIAGWSTDPARGGVVLVGAAGMGKTRLAEELVAVAAAVGVPTARAAGHAEARNVPLAAFAHLVPADAIGLPGETKLDRATLFHRARAALDAEGPRRLLFVDDVDQLDELSRALLSSLIVDRAVFAIVTMRLGVGPIATVEQLVKDGHLAHVEIGSLSADQVETLLHRALGGPLVADTLRQFCEASLGNPGIVRQLVESSRSTGALAESRGVWGLAGPIGTTPTLEGLVADRLDGLDGIHRDTLEILAVAGELGLELLAGAVGDDALEVLDRRGLLAIRSRGRRQDVSLAHPLYGEVIRSMLSTLHTRRIRRELAEMIEAVGARRREDRVRLVAWRIEVGGHVEPDLLVHAARLAIFDHDLDVAQRLLERAASEDPAPDTIQMLAELAFRRGETHRVESLLASIDLDGLDDHQRARVVRRRATNLFFHTMRYEASYDLLDAEISHASDPETRRALEGHLAMVLANGGQIARAIERAEPALPDAAGETRLELLRALGLSYVHAARPLAGLELAREGQRLHAALDNDISLPGLSMLMFIEVGALTAALRVDEARVTAHRVKREHPEVVATWIDNAIGRLELTAGRTSSARRALTTVINDSRAKGHDTTERWVLALHAMTHVLDGRCDLAGPELERVAALEDGGRGLYHSEIDRAHAWYAAGVGDLARAHHLLRIAIDDCARRGASGMVSALLHDLARFGEFDGADRLDDIAAASDGDLFVARALHVGGIVRRDPDAIGRAVELFERGGAMLYAAEAATAHADLLARLGRDEAASVAMHADVLRRAGGSRLVSPALDDR